MKFNKFLFGAAALSMGVFASCSSDEPVKGPEGGNGNTEGAQYMSVRIQSVGNPGSRAATDNDFEGPAAGSAEGTITPENVRFYFFTEDGLPFVMTTSGVNGEVSNTNMVKPEKITVDNTNGSAISLDATLVLGEPTEYKGNKPAKVFCVANATDEAAFAQFAKTRLEDIYNIKVNTPGTWTKFRMTSSTYLDKNGELVYWTNVTDKIKNSKEAALADPADIFIERLAVKMRVAGLDTYSVKEKNEDGSLSDKVFHVRSTTDTEGKEDVTLNVELTGWQPYMTANRAFAIKNISTAWTNENLFNGWNNADLHRSYWATDPGLTNLNNNNYNLYDANSFAYYNYDNTKPTENIFYTYESTGFTPKSATDRSTNATAIVVRGVVKDSKGNAFDMCEWGGDYFTTEYFKQVIVNAYNEDKDPTAQATAEDVTFAKNVATGALANTYYAKVKGNDFTRFSNIQWWQNGITSYFVNVEHLGAKFGVVRNHIYDYTFTNVIGLGVPGNDPKNPEEVKPTYLAARINCLNWHVIGNSVVLE